MKLLDLGADPNRQDRKGRSPGHCGCAKGQFETVKLLNARGANLWLRNARGDLPVHEAAASGRIELVEWLLQQKPNHINSSSNDGRTILHIAAGNDNIDMCKMLIEMGGDVNAVYRNTKNVVKTPLDCALQKGFRTTAKFIQTHEGLPANKLRLSGRKTHNILPELDEVKPLKFTEIEVSYETKGRRTSESDSEGERSHRRKKHRKCSHTRRTSSCSDTFICHRADEPCEISRSKSSSDLQRRRKSKQCSMSSSSNSDSSQSESSDEECCYHTKRKHRCYKKTKNKSKERDGSKRRQGYDSKRSESSECKENGDKDQLRGKKDKRKVEIASSAKKNDNKASSTKAKGDQKATKAPMSAGSKKRPPSGKPPSVQKRLSQDEKQKSIDKPKTPDLPDELSIDLSKKSTTTTEEASEEDKSVKEIIIEAEVHENLQTDVDEGALTDATYTVERRDKSELNAVQPTTKEPVESATSATTAQLLTTEAKKVSFKNDGVVDDDERKKAKTPEPPVEQKPTEELKQPTATEKSPSPLPPEREPEYEEESPEDILRPKSQTPESVGSFTVLEDGDDAEQKLREFEEMTQDETFLNMEDDESEQQYFDDSSSLEKLPRRSKKIEIYEEEGFKILDESKDQDSGIEPSPRAHRSKIPAPRSSVQAGRSFVVTDERPQSSRAEGRKPGDKNAVNMTTVTQSIQRNMRR